MATKYVAGEKRHSRVSQVSFPHEGEQVEGSTVVTNELSVAYPYTPFPVNLSLMNASNDRRHHAGVGVEGDGLDGGDHVAVVPGCAKAGVWNLRYKEAAATQEFTRFSHRSLDGASMLMVFGLGSLLNSSHPHNGNFNLGVGTVMFFLFALEVGAHAIYRAGTSFTYDVAKFRAVVQILSGILLSVATSWSEQSGALTCIEDATFRETHGGQEASDRLYYDSCLRVFEVTSYYGELVALVVLRIDIYIHPFVTLLHFLLQLFATIFPPFPITDKFPDWSLPPKELVGRIFMMLMGMVVSNLVALGKHRANQAAFEAALDLQYQIRASKKNMDAVDRLMVTMVPSSALPRLLEGRQVFDHAPMATILFSDMVQFTSWSSGRTPSQVVGMLSELIRAFDILAAEMGVNKVKTIGDCYWAVTGVPDYVDRHAQLMISFALAMLQKTHEEAKGHPDWDYDAHLDGESKGTKRKPVQFRTGIHSGPVDAGILGTRQISYEVFGATSDIANQVEAKGQSGRVTVSARTKRVAEEFGKSSFTFTRLDIGEEEPYNNEDEEVRLYLVQPLEAERQSADAQSAMSSHMSSSRRPAGDVPDQEREKYQRKQYLEAQLQQQGGFGKRVLSEMTSQELTDEYTIKLSTDASSQTEYRSFVLVQMILFRVGGQLILVGCMLVALMVYLMESGSEGVLTSFECTVLWVVGLLFATGSAALALRRQEQLLKEPPESSTSVDCEEVECGPISPGQHSLSTLEDIVGPLFAHIGLICYCVGSIVSPSSILTTDCLWVLPICFVLVTIPNSHLPPLSLWVGITIITLVCFVNVQLKSHSTFAQLVTLLLGLLGHWLVPILNAKRLRVHFIETKVANHFVTQQAIGLQAQRALLTSMLPDFVINPLAAWIASGYDPDKAVIKQYDETCVAFLRMSPAAQVRILGSPGSGNSLNPSEQKQNSGAQVDMGNDENSSSFDWLFAGHTAVDAVLATTKVVDKVKTVGDLVVVAGSFRGHSGAKAAAALLSVVVRIHSQFETGAITVGLHAGPLMGIVLGFSRLAFDIFGDTVNTASRISTSTVARHKIAASQEYLSLLPEAAPFTLKHPRAKKDTTEAWSGSTTVDYGPIVKVTVKGKGDLQIQEIQYSEV